MADITERTHILHTDIESNSSTIEKLLKHFNVEKYEDLFAIIIKQTEHFKYDESLRIKSIELKKIQIGDVICVKYTPCSQKYIDYYDEQDVKGKVFFVDIENNDVLVYRDMTCYDENNNISIHTYVKSMKRLGCGYFGTKDYYENIYLCE